MSVRGESALLFSLATLALRTEGLEISPPAESSLATSPEPRFIMIHTTMRPLPESRFVSRFNHTPVVDSLVPGTNPSDVAMPTDHKRLTAVIIVSVLAAVGLCAIATLTFFLVRWLMRRAAVKRRRQASWILRSGLNQWNMEPKQTDLATYETRTDYSDASSFSAYPYPLSEHF